MQGIFVIILYFSVQMIHAEYSTYINVADKCLYFFLFHPKDYYNLSFCTTFSNTFGNLWESRRAYAQWRILCKL